MLTRCGSPSFPTNAGHLGATNSAVNAEAVVAVVLEAIAVSVLLPVEVAALTI
jgi:hypothetical protein